MRCCLILAPLPLLSCISPKHPSNPSLPSSAVRGNVLPADKGWIRLLLRLHFKHPEGFTVEQQEVWHSGYILIRSDHGREAGADQEITVFKIPLPVHTRWDCVLFRVRDAVKSERDVHGLNVPPPPRGRWFQQSGFQQDRRESWHADCRSLLRGLCNN